MNFEITQVMFFRQTVNSMRIQSQPYRWQHSTPILISRKCINFNQSVGYEELNVHYRGISVPFPTMGMGHSVHMKMIVSSGGWIVDVMRKLICYRLNMMGKHSHIIICRKKRHRILIRMTWHDTAMVEMIGVRSGTCIDDISHPLRNDRWVLYASSPQAFNHLSQALESSLIKLSSTRNAPEPGLMPFARVW